jgi:hypothetical protein
MTYPCYTYSEDLYSDFHKEAYGFRPGESTMMLWNEMTPDEKQQEWDNLHRTADQHIKEEAESEQQAIAAFESEISDNLSRGASDRKTAIRWILQANNISEEDMNIYKGEYACHVLGLPFEMAKEFI